MTFEVRDLTCFSTSPMPLRQGKGGKQCLVSNLMGQPLHTAYYEAASAMAEVTYSRLCRIIGLACVQADYAVGLQPFYDHLTISDYVSVSEYQEEWITFESALRSQELLTNADNESWIEHFGLGLLLFQTHWSHRGAGYIREDGSFIKANNGAQFFSFELRKLLEGQAEFYQSPNAPISVTEFIRLSSRFPQIINVLGPMSNLTDDQIDQCATTPENWRDGKIGTPFFTTRLKMGRDCARRILKALEDDAERLFDGL